MKLRRHILPILILFPALLLGAGCASTAGRIALTPLSVVRDVVDVPLVTVTNIFEAGADRSSPNPLPRVIAGWSLRGGPDVGFGWDLSWYLFKPLSLILGGVDYAVCRSIWPNSPWGLSPWKHRDRGWGSLYFPNTRALWRNDAISEFEDYDEEREYRHPDYDGADFRLPPPPELG